MGKVVGHLWSVVWPHWRKDEAPGGLRVKAQVFVPCGPGKGAVKPPQIQPYLQIGDGYELTISAIEEPQRSLTPEKKANLRQKRLRRRLEGKYPLFAEAWVGEEIEKKPDYYLDGKSDYDQVREVVLTREAERYAFFMDHPNEVIIPEVEK